MTNTAYIGLGGNMGEVDKAFARALSSIDNLPGIRVEAVSSIYRTQPQGDADQPWFSNQVARLRCDENVTAEALLAELLRLEHALGRMRDRGRRYGPRVIDLDLLLFGGTVCTDASLTLPHPRMTQRAFVLVPLLELTPDLALPGGQRLDALLAQLAYTVDGTTIRQEDAHVR